MTGFSAFGHEGYTGYTYARVANPYDFYSVRYIFAGAEKVKAETIEAADGRWSLAVIGRNLTEEEVLNVTQPLFGYYLGYIGAPRTITVQGTYRFGN